ncbi:CLUMA_CG021645, isoform A [Clunio marinus]|uniref:CLUMA_CG021645, isoform A n=1 Tax=Clunio marinus TaxID=568069 RepID=A0A1J1JAV7_9DIPT|nr:CLUMA_CG021645, isoform A [Clunio marinus]
MFTSEKINGARIVKGTQTQIEYKLELLTLMYAGRRQGTTPRWKTKTNVLSISTFSDQSENRQHTK